MTAVTKHALRVYAALSGLKSDDEGDVLDALIPFLEPVLASMNGKIFDGAYLALGVQKIYGWRFNRDVAESFVGRLLAKGYLVRTTPNSFGVTFEGVPAQSDDEIEIGNVLDRIIDDFEQFPPRITDLFNFDLDREHLKDILIRFLVSFDAFTQEAFAAQVERLKLGIREGGELDQLEEGGRALSKEDQYLCARFVHELVKNKPEFVPHLARLASIGLLTEVVQDFVKPTVEAKKSDLTLILDAPVALDLLGLSGPEAQTDIVNVVDSLRGIGCNVIVLPVSVDEMSRNLDSMLALPTHDRHGPTHAAMRKGQISEDFVRTVRRDPERALQRIGVTVRPVDLTTTPSLVRFFDAATYEDYFAGIRWKIDSVAAREHDATCAALTMRMRAGHRSSDPLAARFVFVTTNPVFVRYTRDFCRKNRMINDRQAPPVIAQRDLAMTAWLRTGLAKDDLKAKQLDIPRGHLMASCERVLRPRKEVLKAVHDKLKQFAPDKAQQYELLLSDQRSVERLMDETLGSERLATEADPIELLEEMRTATAQDVTTKYEKRLREAAQRHGKEKRELRVAAEAEIAQARQETQVRSGEVEALRREANRLRSIAIGTREAELGRIDDLMATANAATRKLDKGLFGATVAVAGVSFVGTFAGLPQAVALGCGGVFSLISAYHTVREIQGKPKLGFQQLLDGYARFRLRRGLRSLGLQRALFEQSIDVNYGKLTWQAGGRERLLSVDEPTIQRLPNAEQLTTVS